MIAISNRDDILYLSSILHEYSNNKHILFDGLFDGISHKKFFCISNPYTSHFLGPEFFQKINDTENIKIIFYCSKNIGHAICAYDIGYQYILYDGDLLNNIYDNVIILNTRHFILHKLHWYFMDINHKDSFLKWHHDSYETYKKFCNAYLED